MDHPLNIISPRLNGIAQSGAQFLDHIVGGYMAAGYTHAQAVKMAKKAHGGNLVGGDLLAGNLVGGKQKYLKYKWFFISDFLK